MMKIILSRKGFDSSAGGVPSPILSDDTMLPLPIPDKQSSIFYHDIRIHGFDIGGLVEKLTKGRIPRTHRAHLDPDLIPEAIGRQIGWKPIFGQQGSAQGHLQNCGVGPNDVFLFFGLYRRVVSSDDQYYFDKESLLQHVLWGWLQVEEVLFLNQDKSSLVPWAAYHPHMRHKLGPNNVLYLATKNLHLPGTSGTSCAQKPGGGVFKTFSQQLELTAPGSKKVGTWLLPKWFIPSPGKTPLTYHGNEKRWQNAQEGALLRTCGRGQEFIIDCNEYPEAFGWLRNLLGCE